jgi:inosine/xanthosine triphosphate pyrophosphatase family protein
LFEHNTINELGQDIQGYWRMKDIHDLWLMTRAFTSGSREGIPVELKYISLAVEVAFASREQDPRLIQRVISRDFGCSTGSKRRWKSYRNKAPCPDELPAQLHTIVDEIVEFIEPLLKEMLQRRGGLERIVQEGSSTSAPDIQAPASSVEPLDTTAMISELPGGWNVLRNQAKVEFEDVGFEEVQELLKGPTNNLMFGDRSEQYDVALVKPSKGTRRGFVTLKQAPPFTMRSCTAYLVARRVPVQSPSNANIPHSTHVVTGREELQKPRSSAELEFDKAEIPQNEAEKGAFEAGKHLLANRLARRLDVLPPLQTLVFVTSSQAKYLEAKKCLAEWQDLFLQGPPSVKPPSPSPRSSFWRGPESAVRSMARYCFDILQTPCLVDFTFLEVAEPSGGAPLLYSSSDINDLGSVDNFLETNYGRSATLRSFLGYLSSNSGRVLLFEGSLEGHIRSATSADADDGAPSLKIPAKVPMDNRDQSTHLHDFMETVFVPEGYAQPLINMSESSFCLGVRHVPLLELAQSLRGRDYSQLFEVHVTVETPEVPGAMLRFEEHCADLSQFGFPIPVKPVLIENASGEVPTQMMTSSYHRGTLSDVHLQSFRLSQALVRAGYVVSRTKIEALLSSRGVPVTDTEAQRLSPENYFEFHIKLRLPGDCPLEPLRMLAERHGARLSRNALSKSVQTSSAGEVVESWQRRFVNLRLYQVGRDTALERFQACVEDLEQSGYAIEKLIREYSVYDSNVALDRGWIDRHATASAKS